MPRGRRPGTSTDGIASLRKQVRAMMKRLQRAGHRELATIEREITKLHRQREGILDEISAPTGQKLVRSAASARGRRGRRARVDWPRVFSRLPKGSFRANDVRGLIPGGVASGTLSHRLTGWVKAKKLKRTGSRRGTRYAIA